MPTAIHPEQLPFFDGMPQWALDRLGAAARERRLDAGELVVRQVDEAIAVHFLLEGRVHVLVHYEGVGDLLMGTLHDPGTLIGWSAFRPPYRYTASIRCEESSRLLQIRREAFEAVFEEDPLLGYEVLKQVAGTVDARLEATLHFSELPEER